MNITVSIIVPVYRVQELYLRKCIESLISQTYKDLDIILVDDGSDDGSGEICDKYAGKDKRIRVIHQENQGVSVARNHGMKVAWGGHLMFVDADDWLDEECVERTMNAILNQGVNLLFFNQVIVCDNNENVEIAASRALSRQDIISISKGIVQGRSEWNFMIASSWGMLISKDYIERYGLQFPTGTRIGEDEFFNLQLLEHLDSAYYLEYAGYHYRIHSDSICEKNDSKAIDDAIREIKGIGQYIEQYHSDDENYYALLGCHALDSIHLVEARYIYHPDNKLTRGRRIAEIKAYCTQPVIAKYISYINDKNLTSFGVKIKFYLLKNGHYGLYDLWRKSKS